MPSTTLDLLRPGQSGKLLRLGGERLFRRRLMELGLVPGTSVRLIRRAPLGGVLELEVRGSLLSLRLDEAATMTIEGA